MTIITMSGRLFRKLVRKNCSGFDRQKPNTLRLKASYYGDEIAADLRSLASIFSDRCAVNKAVDYKESYACALHYNRSVLLGTESPLQELRQHPSIWTLNKLVPRTIRIVPSQQGSKSSQINPLTADHRPLQQTVALIRAFFGET